MAIRAGLDGDDHDLHFLSEHFPVTDGSGVLPCKDQYWLVSPSLNAPTDLETRHQVAIDLIATINGIAWGLDHTYHHVTLSEQYVDETSGKSNVIRHASVNDRIHISSTVTAIAEHAGPLPPPRMPEGTRRLQLAISDPEVDKVFRLLNNPNGPDWVDLYKIYEIIKEHVDEALRDQPWEVSKEKGITLFRRTANTHRHGVPKGDPPRLN